MVIDAITYNGEQELFDLRYNILKDYVDEFIVVEFDKTFSGKNKPWYFFKSPYLNKPKINYFGKYEPSYNIYKDLAEASPNTAGADHWKREFMQKESIKDCLTHLKDDDLVFLGDCDEIYDINALKTTAEKDNDHVKIMKLKLKVYTYYLNNRSSEEFWGTVVGRYGDMKNECFNHLRTNSVKSQQEYGWHFTSLKDGLQKKLTDSYTKETYANDLVMDNLEKNIEENKDFLGRPFTFTVDESEWPEYLKKNKEKYRQLCK